MQNKTADEFRILARNILSAAGANEQTSIRVAEALVLSNLSGVDSHGIWLLPAYVSDIKKGLIVPTAQPDVIAETANTALITGNWTFGHVAVKYAMDMAIRKAKERDVAVVGVVQANHMGRLGEYAEMAASQRMISIICGSGYGEESPSAVPYGGRKSVLSTNPISMGFPASDEPSVVLDFSTTAVANAKVTLAKNRNDQLPLGCLVDVYGNPTTDPNVLTMGGGHLPFGGHKGYSLMLAVELLGRILTGADSHAEACRGSPAMRHQGVTLIVFKADVHQSFADYSGRTDELEQRMRSNPPAPGFKEVLVPGDPETRARSIRRREGIPVTDDVWQSLTDLATTLGVDWG